jgi:hypothetical protein
MKRLFTAIVATSGLLFICAVAAQSQAGAPPPTSGRDATSPRDPNDTTEIDRYVESIGTSRDLELRELRVLKKGLLAPAEDDRQAAAEFLKQPDTGLIRLMPRESFDGQVYHIDSPITIRGGGAYFSFARLTHVYGWGSDIALERDRLSVGFAGADYGMIADLGTVPLDEVTVEYPAAVSIANYKAPFHENDARREARRFANGGIKVNGLTYSSRVLPKIGNTYLLRSIVYDRTDVLVAFNVVRKDSNGSLIIAWKLLRSFHSTKLDSQ